MNLTRRSFVGSMGAGVAALGTTLASDPADAQLVYMPADWHAAEFDKLVKTKARMKQLFDCEAHKSGEILGPMKNSINGLRFGYNIPADQIKVVGAWRGQANLLNFDDSMWEKYKLGEFLKIDDPKTSKPAIRNVYYPKKEGAITDPQDRESIYQDTSIEALCARGLVLLSCHNATENQARSIVKRLSLTVTSEEVTKDLQAHMLPGVISVPAMVAAIAVLQVEGNYAYTVG
jgi:hypothetical protein